MRRNSPEMLPVPEPLAIPPEGSSDETLHQKRLRDFFELEKQYLDIRARYLASYKRLQDSVITGAAIQTGNYKVESRIYSQRHPKYKQVVIDLKGDDFQKRILADTVPTQHFRVRVH